MLSLLGHINDFQVFGSDYPTTDGTAVRDYIHVSDLADAHVEAVSQLVAGQEEIIANLGTGAGFSVKQVLNAIVKEAGIPLPTIEGPRRPGDPPILVAATSKAEKLLNFRPKYSDLSTIVQTAWAWHSVRHPKKNNRCG
jgi:UDP-glucose 4-epimerase